MSFLQEHFTFTPDSPFALFKTNASQVLIHCHDCLEINYIHNGTGHYLIENRTYPIAPGDFFLINNSEHHMAVHDGSLNMTVLVFDASFVWDNSDDYDFLLPFFSKNPGFSNRFSPSFDGYTECTKLFNQIAQEKQHQSPGWRLMVKSLLLVFLAHLNRQCLTQGSHAVLWQSNSFYDKLRPVIEYIHLHFTEDITLDQLGAAASLNPSYLSACFSETMKIRIFEYIEQVRISHAKLLLRTTFDSITDISTTSGFNSPSYFNRVFKKITHITPRQYRNSTHTSQISKIT